MALVIGATASGVNPSDVSAGMNASGVIVDGAAPLGVASESRVGHGTPVAAPPESLTARVSRAVAARWNVGAADVRLQFGALPDVVPDDAPFRLSGAGLDGNFVATLRPGAPDAVAIRVRAGALDTIAVATRPIAAGARLNLEDLRDEVRIAWGPPRASRTRPAPGWEARRALAPGEALTWPAVVQPPLIASGDPVILKWTRGGVSVSMAGVALSAAAAGERLRARVGGRAARVTAIATGPGAATLTEEGAR